MIVSIIVLQLENLAANSRETRGSSFFRETAIFGGLAYRFARSPLTLIAEYESDQYDREIDKRTVKSPSAWNLGLHGALNGISLRASWLRGDTLGLRYRRKSIQKESVEKTC